MPSLLEHREASGAATAEAFAEEGCNLALAARNRSALDALAATLNKTHGVEVMVHAVDLRLASGIAALAAAQGDVDILANNAGDVPGGSLEALTRDASPATPGPEICWYVHWYA